MVQKMKSITIHNLDDTLNALIREKARKERISFNKIIQQLLRQALGLKSSGNDIHKNDFSDLCGVWDKNDLKEFNKKLKEFNETDMREWK